MYQHITFNPNTFDYFLSQNFKSIAAALITVKQGVFMSVMIAYSKALSVSLKLGMVWA